MGEERARILKMLAEGRVKLEEATEMLDALEPAESSGAAASAATNHPDATRVPGEHATIIEMLASGRIEAGDAVQLLHALNARPIAPVNTFTLAPKPPTNGSERHLRLKWHDASGKLIEQVDVAAPLDDAKSLQDMLPEKALDLLDEKKVDLLRLAEQARKLPGGTIVYHYDNDNAQGIEVRVEG